MPDLFVNGTDRKQRILLPDTLDEYVDENNPVRFIDAFVDSLDLVALGLKHSVPAGTGRPPYNPGDILRLYMYGYLNSLRSSRKLEQETYRNMEVIWLMKKLRPDHKTIADFRKDNAAALKEVFKQFVFFCRELDLFGAELIGIDSTKLRAVNSFENNVTKAVAEKKISEIDGRIEKYIREMENQDEIESRDEKKRKVRGGQSISDKIKQLKQKEEHYSRMLDEMASTGEHEISLTDHDCRAVRSNGHFMLGYNTHTAVDSKNDLIVDYAVTNKTANADSLFDMASAAKQTLDVDTIDVVADLGYFSAKEVKKCVDAGITPYVPAQDRTGSGPSKSRGIPTPEFYDDKFVYDRKTDTYICPANKRLTRYTLAPYRSPGMVHVTYKSDACRSCRHLKTACTNMSCGRRIYRWEHQNLMDDMKERVRNNPSMMSVRKAICEHPFGTIKRTFNRSYLLLKGFSKVRGEIGLTMLAYNMRRVLNIIGTKKLVMAATSR